MIFYNEQLLQLVTNDFLKQVMSEFGTSKKEISQRLTGGFTTSNEQGRNLQRVTRNQ